jgi:RsiW-degrading membrane proteinase PrsW (M82 family)
MSIDLTPGQPQHHARDLAGVIGESSSPSSSSPSASPTVLSYQRPNRVPTHFFVATLLLYALVLGTFLLNLTKLRYAEPNWRTLVPFGAGVSFYVASTLFLLILGRGQISRWTVLLCITTTLVLTTLLCLILRAGLLIEQVPAEAAALRQLLINTDQVVKLMLAVDGWLGETIRFAGMFTLEEAIKLLPVFLLIATGRIRNAHGAMLCGALSGLTFGAVEAISYGYLVYPAASPITPVSTYLTRFFIMSPLHGIWDALAGGLVFFLSGRGRSNTRRGPTIGSAAAAFACAVVFHVTHNAFQAIVGAPMQIVTVFMLLAPLYHMAKAARRRAAAEGSPDGGQLVGDLALLTFSLSVGFLAISLLFSWVLGIQRA